MQKAVWDGEFGLTTTLMQSGFTIDTLLLAYQGVDWTDRRNWDCNHYTHPSRMGTYFGISTHPLETIFQKTSWAVEGPMHVETLPLYTKWAMESTSSRSAASPG